MRYLIGFIMGVLFAASVVEHREDCEARNQRAPNRNAPSLRRVAIND